MKQFIKFLFLALVLLGMNQSIFAQFTLSGEFRPRTEYNHGLKKLFVKDADYSFATEQRTRLNLDYKTAGYRAYLSLQDVRVWGSVPQLKPPLGPMGYIHQAYVEAFIADGISVKFGRQEIAYDDHRIMGTVGWAQQARSHDAFVFKYTNGDGLKADLGLTWNHNRDAASYRAFQYLWLHNDFGNIKASVLALRNGLEDAKKDVVYSNTIGTRTGYKSDKLSAFVNFYLQNGDTPGNIDTSKTSRTVSATLMGLDLKYKVGGGFTVGAGIEIQSGNDFTKEDAFKEENAFFPLYGTNHKFNGHMDYFYVGSHKGSFGLQDIFLNAKYKVGKGFVAAAYHNFSAAADFFDTNGKKADKGLGGEIDLSGGFPLSAGVTMKLGYSHMLPTESMQLLKGGSKDETSNWGWMMLVVKPKFFTTKKD